MTLLRVLVDGDEVVLGTYADIAKALNTTTNQIYMWRQRAARNGFPEPAGYYPTKFHHRPVPHFDVDEVLAWRIFYVPKPGGFRAHRKRNSEALGCLTQ